MPSGEPFAAGTPNIQGGPSLCKERMTMVLDQRTRTLGDMSDDDFDEIV